MKLERLNENFYIFTNGTKKIGIDLCQIELWKDGGHGDTIHRQITAVTLLKIALRRNDIEGISAAVADLDKLGFKFPHYNQDL